MKKSMSNILCLVLVFCFVESGFADPTKDIELPMIGTVDPTGIVNKAVSHGLDVSNESTQIKKKVENETVEKCELIREHLLKLRQLKVVYKDGGHIDDFFNVEGQDLIKDYGEILVSGLRATYPSFARKSLKKSLLSLSKDNGEEYLSKDSKEFKKDCEEFVFENHVGKYINKDVDNLAAPLARKKNLNLSFSKQMVGPCEGKVQKSGLANSQLTSCNELSNTTDADNEELLTLLSGISYAVKPDNYFLIGSDHYCNECLSSKFANNGGKNLNFNRAKEVMKDRLVKVLAREKVKASFMQMTNYLEKIEKIANLNQYKIDEGNPNDFYCLKEMNDALAKCGNRIAFKEALTGTKLSICSDKDCSDSVGIFKNLRKQVSTRTGNPASCYEMESSQLRDRDPIMGLETLFDTLKDEKYRDKMFSLMDKIYKKDPNTKPYIAFSEAIGELARDKGSNKEIAAIYEIISNKIDANPMATKKGYDVETGKLISFFWKTFTQLPEVELVFNDKDLFIKEFIDYYDNKEKSQNFINYLNKNVIDPKLNVSLDRLKSYKKSTCEKFQKSLEEGLCLKSQDTLDNFSPIDIANAAQILSVGDNENIEKEMPITDSIALTSVSCEVRNNLNSKVDGLKPTIGKPTEYMNYPSSFAWSKSGDSDFYQSHDRLKQYGDYCAKSSMGGSLQDRKKFLGITDNGSSVAAVEQNREAAEDVYKHKKEHMNTEAANNVNELYSNNTSEEGSYGCYGGTCSNTSESGRAREKVVSIAVKPIRPNLLTPTIVAPELPKTLSMVDITPPPVVSSNPIDDSPVVVDSNNTIPVVDQIESISPQEVSGTGFVNPFEGITGSGGEVLPPQQSVVPSYNPYASYGMQNNETLSASENESRKKTMQNIYKNFPDTFSPEQLEGLSNNDLEKLLEYAESKSSKDKDELEEEKQKLAQEKASFEKEKVQLEIQKLQEEKKKLIAENTSLKLESNKSNSELIPSGPIVGSKNNSGSGVAVHSSYDSETPNVQSISKVSDVSRAATDPTSNAMSNFANGSASVSTTGYSGAMKGGTTGATIAALKEYKSSYKADDTGTSMSQEVDNYLQYVQTNHVAASEIIRRGPKGELVELLIPNSEGELVSLDMSKLSDDEKKKLESKVATLMNLESQKSGVKLATGVNVKTGRGLASIAEVQDIDDKIATLNNELQEAYLDDLKQNILQAILSK